MPLVIYGIRNCDTMKKARSWLAAAGVACDFHDYRRDGVTADMLARWCEGLGWEVVLNRRGTTFRRLPAEARANLDTARAVQLMLAEPALIKRPILEGEGVLLAGFSPAVYASALAAGGC